MPAPLPSPPGASWGAPHGERSDRRKTRAWCADGSARYADSAHGHPTLAPPCLPGTAQEVGSRESPRPRTWLGTLKREMARHVFTHDSWAVARGWMVGDVRAETGKEGQSHLRRRMRTALSEEGNVGTVCPMWMPRGAITPLGLFRPPCHRP